MDNRNQILFDRLTEIAGNLWWSWQPQVARVFRDIDPIRWRAVGHNPVALLQEISPEHLAHVGEERGLHVRVDEIWHRMQAYLASQTTWADRNAGALGAAPVAYFSAEFGLHESLPIYSGGLGVLAGDHLKSASDLGVPLVGIGLFYRQGYFFQTVDANGRQHEDYRDNDPRRLPFRELIDPHGRPVQVAVETRKGTLHARVWDVRVGRARLLLLDSDVDANSHEDRQLTMHLYGGDVRTRIRQELLLGVGGVRALTAAGIRPGVLHLNEGHCAFAVLEVARQRIEAEGIDFEEAGRRVALQTVFTTHTPVPAGHDRFEAALVEEHLGPLRDAVGLTPRELLALGRVSREDDNELFCMTVLALKLSRYANGVSRLHGDVSRQMWQTLWPLREVHEVPIGHITNGVHLPTWLAEPMARLFERRLGAEWQENSSNQEVWDNVDEITDAELWRTHETLKGELIAHVRHVASEQAERRGEGREVVEGMRRALRGDVLLLGFARRFATYKRATLVLWDLDRLDRLVNDPSRPVQLVYAGKAHPRDEGGKALLQHIHKVSREPRFLGKVIFLENYDIGVGRHLVQGVDVWLNNPRRPLEASGTSGEKVVLNAGLNCSIPDGWWAEGFDGANGFAIGSGYTHRDPEVQDRRDEADLFHVLHEQVVPMFYTRDEHGLPRDWIRRMKRSLRTMAWRFNADRMVRDYVTECYVPAAGGLYRHMPGR